MAVLPEIPLILFTLVILEQSAYYSVIAELNTE